MPENKTPFYPIIYVRGYAMTQSEQDETTVDPFCGFNLGSAVYRATIERNKPARKFIFESPLVRLITDFQYNDTFQDGLDIADDNWKDAIPAKSVIIYRYYEQASSILGNGKTPEIQDFAKGLSDLILKVRQLVCAGENSGFTPENFRCYLVAHSMGGLVCRAFLQNPDLGDEGARKCVDKVFTYATPHNGIDAAGINVPKWLAAADIKNFNRKYMADYLNLEALHEKTGRVDWLPEEAFSSNRFFCMVGTNRADYEAAMGLSRAFAGHGSDGLVRIDNASVWGIKANGAVSTPCATAYAYRSHSGPFGIVNSEEAYQNLKRFLFGDVRIDIWIDVESVQLPPAIQGKAVNALYQFELLASPRGKHWHLSRRISEEDSVACRQHRDLTDGDNLPARNIYLSTVFLSKSERVDPERPSLAYGLTLAVRVQDYEVDRKFWLDSHYEGGKLFNGEIVMDITLPESDKGAWTASYNWRNAAETSSETRKLDFKTLPNGKLEGAVPFGGKGAPGIAGHLRFVASAWK